MMRWSEEASSLTSAHEIKNHSVTHFKNYLYCFGGYDGRRNHNALWLYSIADKRWMKTLQAGGNTDGVIGSNGFNLNAHQHHAHNNNNDSTAPVMVHGTPPPGRNGHSATLATDPDDEDATERARIIIIGGWLGTGPLAASDCHVLEISAGGRQLQWYQPAVRGNPPGACNMHSADFCKAKRSVYVFRGGNGREYLNDLHALHVDTYTWSRVETTGAIPQQRANHSSAMLEETGELFIFGGWNGGERLNDIHILDTATNVWTCPRVGGVLPHPRAGMTLTALRGRLFLFGGSGTSAKCFQDLQILDRQEMAWLDVTQDADTDAGRNRGGNNSSNSHNDNGIHYETDESIFRFGGPNMYENDRASSNAFGHGGDYDGGSEGQQGGYDNFHHYHQQDAGAFYNAHQQGSTQEGPGSFMSSRRTDWRSRDMAALPRNSFHASPNPNDEDTVPLVMIQGQGPGRRAGHTATAVNRKIFVFGGSCGSDYLNDFFVLDTDPPPHAIVNEPTSLQLVERRLRHFFNDEEFSDVTFVVQGQRVYGHRMVLSLVSDCFRAMFTTGFREADIAEIEIPDCTHGGFLSLMEYIYTGHLKMDESTPTAAAGNGDNDQDATVVRLVEMLELADRFFLDHLKQLCESMLQKYINEDTVESVLSVAQKTNSTQLLSVCDHFLRNRDG
ncbi:hypothetical protein MPSEU_001094100 [Mayamaea pseudoterrestris]|nr:hypothetical protein MPSEU_001094100 [Mayamaea pseudoterrestris]